jgi:hypothetical protein
MVSLRYQRMMFFIKHLNFVATILDRHLLYLNNEKAYHGTELDETSDRYNVIEFYLFLRNQITSKIQEMTTLSKNDFSSGK